MNYDCTVYASCMNNKDKSARMYSKKRKSVGCSKESKDSKEDIRKMFMGCKCSYQGSGSSSC